MAARDRMDRLMTHLGDLAAIEAELRKNELDTSLGAGGDMPVGGGIHSMVQTLLTTISESGSFFREETEIIRKISPPVAEQLDGILAAYEKAQAIVEGEFQRESKRKGRQYMSPELMERLEQPVGELIGRYNEMRSAVTISYNSIMSAVGFMAGGGAKKTGRGADGGGGKWVWAR